MDQERLHRRGMLLSGAATPAPDQPGEAALSIEADKEHAPLRASFLRWLNAAQSHLALTTAVHEVSSSRTDLHIPGVHPAIGLSLHDESGFTAWVEWDGMCWDSWLWLDVLPRPVAGGWINDSLLVEHRTIHSTLEPMWRADIFERWRPGSTTPCPARRTSSCGAEPMR